ncbi:superoxide dismutase [Candidatus Acetothermia bacterium]|nr:superoxide dismutase [Candidatus Acetothermia bacterium]MBI3644186.1 superoxide dismutase [Candidatus Acetothermia bacterium]
MGKFELSPLPYDYKALEPHIDAQTMTIHHDKHHLAYTNGLNTALESAPDLQSKPVEEILKNIKAVPENIRGAVNFHGGGFDNHNIFWANLNPKGGGEPSGPLADAVKKAFGDFAKFKEQFSKSAVGIQGSGWGWLVYNPSAKKAEIKTMPNQTSPRTDGLVPLLGLDVWEHAYYLKYQNRRADYVGAWWNVINWADVADRYKNAVG